MCFNSSQIEPNLTKLVGELNTSIENISNELLLVQVHDFCGEGGQSRRQLPAKFYELIEQRKIQAKRDQQSVFICVCLSYTIHKFSNRPL